MIRPAALSRRLPLLSRALAALLTVLPCACSVAARKPAAPVPVEPDRATVFVSGADGYACFRIPSLVVSAKGAVLAFCEGRRNGRSDTGWIDLVLRRSFDGGRTWGPLQIVLSDGTNTWGNPSAVVDRESGRIWLLATGNLATDTEKMIGNGTSRDTRRVYVCHSDDDGATWSARREITSDVKLPDWRWYATGPGHAIQLADGRLVIPANHTEPKINGGHPSHSHVILSDDHGATWHIGGVAGERTNESTVAEIEPGRLYLNMRSYRQKNRRAVAWSDNRGESWSEVSLDPTLIEPVCQASVLRHVADDGEILFLFSNPADVKRVRLTVRASLNRCKTWSAGRLLFPGTCGYSDLCSLSGGTVGCLYERERDGQPYGAIDFARMPLAWLLDAAPVADEKEPD